MQRWDIFCAVVDNFGDIGTCWRLAQQLVHEHKLSVGLWVDNLQSFARLCSSVSPHLDQQVIGKVEICKWSPDFPAVDVADVVIEAFACDIPTSYIAAMAQKPVPPVWINLEYLSAENWVEDCHLLTSPHSNWPLTKTFFFPGFTSKTGGLIKEHGLLQTRAAFGPSAADAFWHRLNLPKPTADELRISLFCYDNPRLQILLKELAASPFPVRVLTFPGPATEQVSVWYGEPLKSGTQLTRGALTVQALPFLSQTDFDQILWACDLNFVRGEDSFVRAQWAQQPFVWQPYPQADDAHLTKLDAFLALFSEDESVRRFWHAWNGRGSLVDTWPDFLAKQALFGQRCKDWAAQLDRLGDLANNLVSAVHGA